MLVGGWNYDRIIYEEMPEEVNLAWDEAMEFARDKYVPIKLLAEKSSSRCGTSYVILAIKKYKESVDLTEMVICILSKKPALQRFSLLSVDTVRF